MPSNVYPSSLSDWIPAFLSAAALILSILAFLRSQTAVRAKVFMELRKEFLEIKANLPDWYAENDIKECPTYDYDSDQWRALESYWQHAFNEWFLTQKLDSRVLGSLWRLFYEDAIKAALKFAPLRLTAMHLTHSKSEFGAYCNEFREVLDRLWQKSEENPSINICDGFDCKWCKSTCQQNPVKS